MRRVICPALAEACTHDFHNVTASTPGAMERVWFTFPAHFDNFGDALLTLFEVATTEGWIETMLAAETNVTSRFRAPGLVKHRDAVAGHGIARRARAHRRRGAAPLPRAEEGRAAARAGDAEGAATRQLARQGRRERLEEVERCYCSPVC